jgi:exosome complex RNA-binding protein Rrp42 (RNase PH superfamily)
MNREIFSRVFPKEFVVRHAKNDERIDGRRFDELRRITLEKSR